MNLLEFIGVVKPLLVIEKRVQRIRPQPPAPPRKCNGLGCCIRGTCDQSKGVRP